MQPSDPSTTGAPPRPRRNDVLDVVVDRIDDRGRGVAWMGEEPLTLRFTNPGARVRARVLGRRKRRFEGHVEEVLDPGPHAVQPRCPHAGVCGGCALPTLDYPEQLRQKERLVQDALRTAFGPKAPGGLPAGALDRALAAQQPIEGATELEGYRNKMDFTFGSKRYILADEPEGVDASFGLGLHAPGLYQKVLDVEHCAIAFDGASAIVRSARELALEMGLAPWDLKDHVGLLRHLVLRKGVRTNQIMVDLVTSERAADAVDAYARALVERHPEITTIVQNVTTKLATVAYGEEEHVLHGPGWIEEILAGKRFRLSADSFFQTNTEQAERLFEIVREEAAQDSMGGEGGLLYDLYCGAGTIGLAIAEGARRIVGFESAPTAVRDARQNASANGVTNAEFIEGDVLTTLAAVARTEPPDVLVVDPPRVGLHPKVPPHVVALGAPRILYVSCNPRSGARDVAELVRGGYELVRLRPIDLFPHTPHVETVFVLERKGAKA